MPGRWRAAGFEGGGGGPVPLSVDGCRHGLMYCATLSTCYSSGMYIHSHWHPANILLQIHYPRILVVRMRGPPAASC